MLHKHISVLMVMVLILSNSCLVYEATIIDTSTATFRLSLHTHLNGTGHWTTQVKVQHTAGEKKDLSFWDVDLERRTGTCHGLPCVDLEVNITAPPKHVGSDYELFPGMGYYKFHTNGHTWTQAVRICEQENTHLAIINSAEEVNVLKLLFARYPELPNCDEENFLWVGVHDMYKEGEYITVFGNPLNSTGYVKWASGNPNNIREKPTESGGQDCMSMQRDGNLNDNTCSFRNSFVCEQEISSN